MNDVNYDGWLGVGLFFSMAMVIIFGIYGYVEADLRAATEARFTAERVERGVELFAENCTDCHGERGEGTRRRGPALNTAEFLEKASDQSIFDTITDGRPNTGMPAWGQANGGPLTAEEVRDLAAFIRAWEPTAPPAAQVETEPDAALGAAIFSATCFGCHGLSGEGTEIAPALNDREKLAKFDDEWYRQTIANGRKAQGMPTWGKVLSPAQINDLVAYIRRWETVPSAATPPLSGGNPVEGAAIFQAICIACHGQDGAGTDRAPTLNDPENIANHDDTFYRSVITEGRLEQGMPRWGQVLSPAEINNLVALIRSWESSQGPATKTSGEEPVTKTNSEEVVIDPELLEKGKQVYDYTAGGVGCAYCHGLDGKGHGESGEDAPNIRGKTATDVKQALSNVIYMELIEMSNEEIEAVGAYLQYLNTQP